MKRVRINISERANRVLNDVKEEYGLKNKSEAVNWLVVEYARRFLKAELGPEFIRKMKN